MSIDKATRTDWTNECFMASTHYRIFGLTSTVSAGGTLEFLSIEYVVLVQHIFFEFGSIDCASSVKVKV